MQKIVVQLLQANYCSICAETAKKGYDRCTHETSYDYIDEMSKHLVLKLTSVY
jgi:hypothetical protein